jgi:general secretion pathway protein D
MIPPKSKPMTRPPLANTIASMMGLFVMSPAIVIAADSKSFQARSGGPSVQAVAEREAVRRYDRSERIGREAIVAGEKAFVAKDYETSFAHYRLACDNIPMAPKSEGLYRSALKGFGEAAVKLAEQRIAEGRYADAENTLKIVLEQRYDPSYKPAITLLANLETPGYFNRTITPKFRGNIEEVKRLFIEAEGYFQSARYDIAFRRCEQILNIDPYNIAARELEEKINVAKSQYGKTAYNETRSRAIWQVDKAWANPVRKFGVQKEGVILQENTDTAGTARITAKLNRIILPKVQFRNTTIAEAIDFLKQKSASLDTQETDGASRGVNIVLKLDPGPGAAIAPPPEAAPAVGIPGLDPIPGAAPAAATSVLPVVAPSDARVTLDLANIPLIEALKYVTQLANLKFKIEPYAVSVVPLGTPTEVLIAKQYKVRPGFIGKRPAGDAALAGGLPPDGAKPGGGIQSRLDAKEYLIAQGVPFPPNASASYSPATSQLIVRNTPENLEFVDSLVNADSESNMVPAQVEIESKFVEINQSNLKELSFDWLLGQFNIGSGGVFGSGGVSGNGTAVNQTNYPFAVGTGSKGMYPVTAGNRSGSNALTATAIDSLLFGGTAAGVPAPGLFAISGIMTDPKFQVVIRALNQKKGVDLLSAPRVTTKNGVKAKIEVVREFIYPTEFDPPQIPQTFSPPQGGGGGIGLTNTQQPQNFPITPTTPTTFTTRNTGVTLSVEPVIGPDGYTVDLQLLPEVVEFEGFINYGSPIYTTSVNALGISTQNIVTENEIKQPIFSTRKVETSVSIFDGQTVVLGGLMREDVQKIEDKVPLLGDVPLVGRLFRSSVDQHLKRNLVIFVTARLINAAGEPVRQDEDQDEIVETLPAPEIAAPGLLPLMSK